MLLPRKDTTYKTASFSDFRSGVSLVPWFGEFKVELFVGLPGTLPNYARVGSLFWQERARCVVKEMAF